MDGTDACAREERSDSVPCHGKVNGHGVALLDAPGLEDIGDSAHFAEELGVGNLRALVGLVCFVDDGRLDAIGRWSVNARQSSGGRSPGRVRLYPASAGDPAIPCHGRIRDRRATRNACSVSIRGAESVGIGARETQT